MDWIDFQSTFPVGVVVAIGVVMIAGGSGVGADGIFVQPVEVVV